jgi:hypothetical protein
VKHLAVVGALVLAICLLAFKKSDLDLLLTPARNYAESQVGNRFVELPPGSFPVTPDRLAEPGVTTIVYFRDDDCAGCRDLDRDLQALLRVRPDVAVRKVAIRPGDNGYSEAIGKYHWRIYMSPCVLLYGPDGKLIAADDRTDAAGYELLMEWMRLELTLARQRQSG